MNVVLDFETANTEVDLLVVGAEVYAQHPATEILCLAVLNGETGEPVHEWAPGDSIERLVAFADNQDIIFEAHNASFEQMVWKWIMAPRYGLPEIPIERWFCTMGQALAGGMMGKLEKLAAVLGVEDKDMEGSDLTISLSKPITQIKWNTPESQGGYRPDNWALSQKAWANEYQQIYDRRPATIARVKKYCMQDCRVEWLAKQRLPPMSPYEQTVWRLDQYINQRGVMIDAELCRDAIHIVAESSRQIENKVGRITGGLKTTQVAQLREWCIRNGAPEELLPDMAAARLDKLTGMGGEEDEVRVRHPDIPDDVFEVLCARRLLGAASVKKFPRMLQCMRDDGAASYTTQYHGAGTGRWAGRLFQPHNFPRLGLGVAPELVAEIFRHRDWRLVEALFGMPAINAASRTLRHAIVARPGRVFDSADFAGVEMRIDLALAGQRDKCEMLRLNDTKEKPVDVYLDMAELIYNIQRGAWTPPDAKLLKIIKEEHVTERTIGKNTVLGCGFQMAGDTFHDRYCPEQDLSFAHNIVKVYRTDWAPEVPKLWKGLEEAAVKAVYEGIKTTAYGITYEVVDNWLTCSLPDGQVMWYREPQRCKGRFGNPAWSYMTWKDGRWQRVQAYGGLLTENVVQKLARGLLVEAMIRLEANGWPVVLTVHDEIVAEPMIGFRSHEEFEQIMAERPDWCGPLGLNVPIAVEGWRGSRFRK